MNRKLHFYYIAIFSFCFVPLNTQAQLILTLTNQTERIDFDSTKANVNEAAYAGSGISSVPTVGELDANAWEIIGMSTATFNYGDSAGSGDFGRGAATRGVATGGLYSFQSTNDGNYLGLQPGGSDMTPGSVTLKVNNNTGVQLDSLRISYTFYSYSDQARSSSWYPSYSTDNVNFTSMPALNDSTEEAINTVALTVGRQKDTLLPITILNGGDFYLRWSTDDLSGSGSRDEFGVDNIEITGLNASGAISVTSFTLSNPSCNGSSDGSATVNTSGGTSPLTYSWSNGVTTVNNTNIGAGTYYVTVTDATSNSAVDSVRLIEPSPIVISTSSSDNACFGGSSGFINSSVSGGTSPYQYAWSNGSNSPNISNLAAGVYTLTVTDTNGCSSTASDTVRQVDQIVITFSDTSVTCGSNNGSIKAIISGGTPNYTYSWSNGVTGTGDSTYISGLGGGTYTLSVTDGFNCMVADSVSITPGNGFAVSISSTNTSTSTSADGSIDVTVSGGTTPYSFNWNDGATTEDRNNLTAGTYTVTVSEAGGCTIVETATITSPSPTPPVANLIITEINYNGPESGTDTTEFIEFVNAGTTTVNLKNYSFGLGVSHTFSSNDSVQAGQYFVIAVDSSAFRNVYGFSPDAEWTVGGLSNGGEIITLLDSLNRLVDSVNYDDSTPWPSGATAGRPDGGGASLVLCDSTSDNNDGTNWEAANTPIGGQIINGFQVFANPGTGAICTTPLTANATVNSNVSCSGGSDGRASVAASGGVMPYSYIWSNSAITDSINNLTAGQYFVTVTDASSNTAIDSVTITAPNPITVNFTITNTTTSSSNDGSISSTVVGGTPPYTYLWSNGFTTANISNLAQGTYTQTVTDANGCTAINSATVMGPNAITTNISSTNVSCNGSSDGSAIVNVSGGTTPYTYLWNNSATTASISNLVAGRYVVTVTDNSGTTAVDSVLITEPTPIAVNLTITNVSTQGGSDGQIAASTSGGVSPYNYSWSNGAINDTIKNIAAGTYCVTVTDANNCTQVQCGTVVEPGPIANLIISEINYNGPEAGTDTSEFIEFVNNGTSTISLSGYSFSQGISHTFTASDSIAPNQYYVIAFDSSAFRNRYGFNADAIWSSGGLSNNGESIVIIDNFGRGIDTVSFDDASPWPTNGPTTGPDGNGSSIELTNLNSNNNDGANWIASTLIVPGQFINGFQVFGTPGNPYTVSISSNNLQNPTFEVYPNPTRNYITVKTNQVNNQEQLLILDAHGKVLRNEIIHQAKIEIDLSSYADGIYLIRIGDQSRKIILNK